MGSQEKNGHNSAQIELPKSGDDEQQHIGPGQAYARIFRYGSTKEYGMQAVATLCAVASGVAMAMVNLVFGKFITVITDYTTQRSSAAAFRNDAAKLALGFFGIGIARFVLSYGYGTLFTFAAYRITRNIRYMYFKAGLSQEIAYFDAGIGGSIAMQATSNGKLIQAGISEKLGLVFQGLACFIAAFILAFITQWKLTLICCCIAPATLIVMGISSAMEASIESQILKVHAEGGSFAESILSSARNVQAFGLRSRLVQEFDKFLDEAQRLGQKKNLLFGCMFSAEYFIIFAGMGLCFWQGIHMLANGQVDQPGDVFIVLMSVIVASSSLTAIAPYVIDFGRAAEAAADLFRLMDRRSKIDPFDKTGEQPCEPLGNIHCENITFSYPMRPGVTVLDDFSLNIPAGKVTALVGASGSGKSTIIGLIERWYSPLSGAVKLDGRPIDKLNIQWLRKNVRLVQQEPVLFSGTVYDNIVNGLVGTLWEGEPREAKLARVQDAAKVAFAHDFILALPNGYDTNIGERGGLLSGGQKQRVAIARSIISQPRILLLDEATSALDPHAEEVVQKALDNVSQGRTTVTIAHKLATIRNADNIVVMDKGRIVEQGTHQSLLQAEGFYTRLVRAQDLSVTTATDSDSDDSNETGHSKPEKMDDDQPIRTLTRYSTTTNARLESELDRDDYDKWKPLGLLAVIWRILKTTPELRMTYIILTMAALGAAAAYPGQAILMSRFIQVFEFTGSAMQKQGNFFALMFLVLACGAVVVYFVVGWSSNVVAQTLNHKYRKQVINDMLRQDLRFFDRPENTTGALASRVDSYPQSIFELMGFTIALILISVVGVLSCCAVALVYGWRLGVIIFAGLPPLLAAGYGRIRLEGAMDAKTSKSFSMSASIASEAIGAIRTVSSLAIEESVLENYTIELERAISHSNRPVMLIMLAFAFTQSVEYAFQALGFWYGCRLVSFEDISMVNFFVAFLGAFFSGQQASILFGFAGSMTKACGAANYVFWLEQLHPTIRETDGNRDNTPCGFHSLDINNIHFSYPMRPAARILRGIDLKISKGQFVAFVGASGCGKSTMIAMLERFYDPVAGQIVLDGQNLDDMNPWKFREEVALVQQEPKLYPGTIRENIALGDPRGLDGCVSVDDIEMACRLANAWDFVCSLPEGLNTPCGSNGLQLSGGQRQRIAIARALIRNPRLLLLDEATSALDTQSERIVQDALNEAAKTGDRITVAIAHRLSTVRHADVICVFYNGKILDAGTHEGLVTSSEMYRKMCEAQNLD